MTDFNVLYERYAPVIHRFALGLCGDPELADDITSETFVRAWTAADTIRQDSVRAYLFTIARNLYRDAWRRSLRRATLDDTYEDARPSAAQQVENRSELGFVLSELQKLPHVDRAALLMRAHEELSYEEIAQALGLSLANVKVRIHRARRKLMSATRDQDDERPNAEES